ncbi:MAG: hypothetical protein J0H02_06700 [Armatimonadetes bacterium]|nr:hypothetical protein [Armatimonadota bacterium]
MHKILPMALIAILAIGCKGGESTMSTSGGGAASPDATYTLKFAPKEGEKRSYEMTMVGGPVDIKLGMNMECTKVDGDKATMVSTYDNVDMKIQGKPAPAQATEMLKSMKVTQTMDSTGKTIDTKVEGGMGGNEGAPEMNGMALPAKPVKIGDTWDGETKVSGQTVKAHYKLTAVDGNIATLEVTMDGLPGGATLDGPMISKIDLNNGMTESMDMKMKEKSPDGKENVMAISMKKK